MDRLALKRSWLGRGVRVACVGAGLVWIVGASGAAAKKQAGLSPYALAVQARVRFEELANEDKSRTAYTRVMDGFRAIYHDHPVDVHAPDAVNAVAELLAEEGRVLGDAKLSRAAIGQYEFLRTQYPGSRLRVSALLAEGRIDKELRDSAGAKKAYAGVVKEAPGSESAGVARGLMAGVEHVVATNRFGASETHVSEARPFSKLRAGYEAPGVEVVPAAGPSASLRNDNKNAGRGGVAETVPSSADAVTAANDRGLIETHVSEARPFSKLRAGYGAPRVEVVPAAGSSASLRNDNKNAGRDGAPGVAVVPAVGSFASLRNDNKNAGRDGAAGVAVVPAAGSSASLRNDNKNTGREGAPGVAVVPAADSSASLRNDNKNSGDGKGLAEVTGIRHWSTPTYTRVAIDLGDEVKFEAARVPHPDRIYFDLHGARLAAELVGKSFDVTDDGFLRRIRAAQATGDMTRVVLDVSDVTEYSAFLLPNPYRLIIDIHGGKKGVAAAAPVADLAEIPVPVGAGRAASAAANSSGLPAMATTDGGEAVRGSGSGGSSRWPPQTIPHAPTSQDKGVPWGSRPHDDEAVVRMGHAEAVPGPAPRTGVVTRSTVARPVPNTVAVKAPATTTEVAAVSAAPGRVEATSAPTSKPIVAVSQPALAASLVAGPSHAAEARPYDKLRAGYGAATPGTPLAEPGKAAEKTAAGETSLVRALGLKIGRIVIDAGHGGHDSGTLGVDGIQEKDVVLDVALRLGRMLHERLGAEIIYTRSDDTFIPLETRTAIANKAQADLFLSIHANSSQDETARGVETYYLNFTSDPTALDVAARENAVGGQGVHQLSDLVKKIALKDKIAESREFASDVEASLYAGLEKGNAGLKNRGVKKAPFVVLIGANMPSILAEISFVTNGRDATQLREPEYRQRVAESLFNGVAKYEGGLAGARPGAVTRAAR